MTNSNPNKRKLKKKKFSMMREKRKTQCSVLKTMIKCAKPKMDSANKNGSQETTRLSAVCNLMMILTKMRALMMRTKTMMKTLTKTTRMKRATTTSDIL